MTAPNRLAEQMARRFHEAYERLAPSFGYETRKETREFDPITPNGKLMIAVCSMLGDAASTNARALVNKQAEDAGLWFMPETITEDYLQRALRELHAAVEQDGVVSAPAAPAPDADGYRTGKRAVKWLESELRATHCSNENLHDAAADLIAAQAAQIADLRDLLRRVLHATSPNMSMDMYAEVCRAIDAARAKVKP